MLKNNIRKNVIEIISKTETIVAVNKIDNIKALCLACLKLKKYINRDRIVLFFYSFSLSLCAIMDNLFHKHQRCGP